MRQFKRIESTPDPTVSIEQGLVRLRRAYRRLRDAAHNAMSQCSVSYFAEFMHVVLFSVVRCRIFLQSGGNKERNDGAAQNGIYLLFDEVGNYCSSSGGMLMVAGAALAIKPINEEDRDRAGLYGLLGSALEAPPSDAWLREVAGLAGDDTVLGSALAALGESAAATSPAEAAREYHDLFIGVGRGELVPFASYYLTGFLHEKPLAVLRADMAGLGIERDPSVKEPEDHAAACCQMMAGLIVGAFGAPMELSEQKQFFRKHIGSWMPYFFKDLENSKAGRLYAGIGRLGRTFLEIEAGAFEMVG